MLLPARWLGTTIAANNYRINIAGGRNSMNRAVILCCIIVASHTCTAGSKSSNQKIYNAARNE